MKKITAWFLTVMLCVGSLAGCGKGADKPAYDKHEINVGLNMKNMDNLVWDFRAEENAWVLEAIPTVLYPEDVTYQSLSIAIPEAYVEGIDTTGDGVADVTVENVASSVNGQMVIRGGRVVNSSTGYEYHSGNAPVLIRNSSVRGEATETTEASCTYAPEGYILVQCGNRGCAPLGLADLKDAILFIRYNILLGNLPGSYNSLVASGGMLAVLAAVTGHSEEFYPAQADAGAIGVFREENGAYTFRTEAFGKNIITDSVWGCVACDPVVSLYSSELFGALERTMNPDFVYTSDFQKQLDEELSIEAVRHLNELYIEYDEIASGYDLNENGQLEEKMFLELKKDPEHVTGQNGYSGSFMNYYLSVINAPENLPLPEHLVEVENMLALSETPLAEADTSIYSSYKEMLKNYESEVKDFYRKGAIDGMYQYHPFRFIGLQGLDPARWVRFIDNPMTSENPVLADLALSSKLQSVGIDANVRMVWDTNLSREELERKYTAVIVDEMLANIGDAVEGAKPVSQNNILLPGMSEFLEDEPETLEVEEQENVGDNKTGIQVGIPMADAVRFESIRTSRVPRYDILDHSDIRSIFDPEGAELHYDAFVLKTLQTYQSELEPLLQFAN